MDDKNKNGNGVRGKAKRVEDQKTANSWNLG